MKAQTGVWIAIFAILVFGGLGFYGLNQMSVTTTTPQQDTGITVGGEENFCANNPSLDLNIRARDILSATTSYENVSFYLKNLETGTIVELAIDVSTGVFDTHSNVLKCGNTKGYELIVKTTQDGINAGEEVVTIKPSELFQDPIEKTLKISKHTLVKVKAYDDDLRQTMGNGASTDYQTVPATFNETGGSAITVGTDGYLDLEFTFAPVSSNEASGRNALLCINYADDSNVDDWEQSSIDLTFEGSALSEATLSANDAMALSAYEKCFSLPHPVGKGANGEYDSVSVVKLYMESQSAVNPDFDPVLRYVEKGAYQSSKDYTSVLQDVVAQDNSARTFLGSATAGTVTITVV